MAMYQCGNCRFVFERSEDVESDPDCGRTYVVPATEEQAAAYKAAQQEQKEQKEEQRREKETICYCAQVSRGDRILAVQNGARTVDDIRRMTGACTLGRCKEVSPRWRCCSPDIQKLLDAYFPH